MLRSGQVNSTASQLKQLFTRIDQHINSESQSCELDHALLVPMQSSHTN